MQWVDSATGLRFAVPRSSTIITGSAVDSPGSADAIQAFADSADQDVSLVRSRLRRTDLLVVGKHRPSIYVADLGDAEIPTEEDLKEIKAREGGFARIDTVSSSVGDITVVDFAAKIGGTVYFKAFLYLRLARGTVGVAVTAQEYSDATYEVSELLNSLTERG